MENNDTQTANSVKWPWIISLILLILGGVSIIPVFILCIYNGAKMNGLTWFLVFLPLLLLAGSLAFGIVSFAKKKTGSLPLIILSGVLGISSLGFNSLGLFMGGLVGAIGSWNDSVNKELKHSVTLEGYLEESEGKILNCSYCGEEECYSFVDSSGQAKDYLKTDFTLKEIEEPYSFNYSAYLYFEHSKGGYSYLYLGDDYSTVKIVRNYNRTAELYYSVSETQGKGLYNTLKSIYETRQSEISLDVEAAKTNATYEKFLTEMDGNFSNPCYYVSKYETLTDSSKQVLALLKDLSPTLSSQKELEIGYDYFAIMGADFVYGLEPGKELSLNCHYAAIRFETGEIHANYSFLDRYGSSHFICSEYTISESDGTALKTQITSAF